MSPSGEMEYKGPSLKTAGFLFALYERRYVLLNLNTTSVFAFFVILAKAEEYKTLGNEKFSKKEYASARDMYTEGIKLSCQDKELNAKLYNNRATQHFYLGKKFCKWYQLWLYEVCFICN